ncbi:MAG: type II secretion protein F [Deltaproteobacteria bacterium]|nr:type II secretion protein F [Deltaproteobacteria bacterium]
MTAVLFAILAALTMGTGLFMLARHSGWNWFSRRYHADVEYVRTTLERMFKEAPLPRCRMMVAAVPALGAGLGVLLTWAASWPVQIVFALLLASFFWWGLHRFMDLLYAKYLHRFEEQLVDALIMASNALRVGLSLPQALEIIAKELPPPVSQEFALALKEHRMGKTLDDALSTMADRIPSLDLTMVVNAVLILRETGGNLAETFDTIVYTFVEREKVKDKIRTLTAQGRVQGIILMAMPFVLGYALNWANPDYMRPLYSTPFGWILITFMILMLTVGGLMINKIVNIDV